MSPEQWCLSIALSTLRLKDIGDFPAQCHAQTQLKQALCSVSSWAKMITLRSRRSCRTPTYLSLRKVHAFASTTGWDLLFTAQPYHSKVAADLAEPSFSLVLKVGLSGVWVVGWVRLTILSLRIQHSKYTWSGMAIFPIDRHGRRGQTSDGLQEFWTTNSPLWKVYLLKQLHTNRWRIKGKPVALLYAWYGSTFPGLLSHYLSIQSSRYHLYPMMKRFCPVGSGLVQSDSSPPSTVNKNFLNGLMRTKMMCIVWWAKLIPIGVRQLSSPSWSNHFMLNFP